MNQIAFKEEIFKAVIETFGDHALVEIEEGLAQCTTVAEKLAHMMAASARGFKDSARNTAHLQPGYGRPLARH